MTGDAAGEPRPRLPERTLSPRRVWSAVRPVVGWALAALGALALFLGWYGVSGEALTAKQLPYLVSGGLTGVALFVMAAAFLVTDDVRRQLGRLDEVERRVARLYALLVEDDAETPGAAPGGETVVALPSGTTYHRPDCPLVAGKDAADPVPAAQARRRGLRPCRVCSPPDLAA